MCGKLTLRRNRFVSKCLLNIEDQGLSTFVLFFHLACSPRVINRRGRCNIYSWKRTYTRTFYRAVNCACRRVVKTKQVSCRCKPKTVVTKCYKKTGVEVTIIRAEKYNAKADRCVDVSHVIRRPTRKSSSKLCFILMSYRNTT